jgi:hypothetical protein
MFDGILIYPLLTAALYYLGGRALVTQFLWSRYPPRFDAFMQCAACTGFWYGTGLGVTGFITGTPFLGSTAWWTPVVIGLAAIVWTPIIANAHEAALQQLGGGAPAGGTASENPSPPAA